MDSGFILLRGDGRWFKEYLYDQTDTMGAVRTTTDWKEAFVFKSASKAQEMGRRIDAFPIPLIIVEILFENPHLRS